MKTRYFGIFHIVFIITFVLTATVPIVSTSTAQVREPYQIELYSIPAGFPPYAISVGVAEIINKNSSWLRAVALEGRGPTEALKYVATDPKKRTNLFFFNQPKWIWAASNQIGPFNNFPFDYNNEIQSVALIGAAAVTLVTLDPNIKSLEDLKGKKVSVDSGPGRGRQIIFEAILKQVGILDNIKFEYMRGNAAADAMRDGLIDACYFALDLVSPPNNWRPNGWGVELLATKDVHFIPIPRKYYEKFKEETGHLGGFIEFPPKFISKLQDNIAGSFVSHHSWNVHSDMPDDVVREFTRIIYENAEQLVNYNPFGAIITQQTMATMGVEANRVHPAALKFYKEKNVQVGSFR